MDRELEVNFHLIKKNIPQNVIQKVHDIVQLFGFELGDSSTLLLYDPEMEMNFDIEPAIDIEHVIERMTSWPQLGVVGYEYKKWIVDISFRKYKEKNSVHCVSFSFSEKLYRNSACLYEIKKLVLELHQKLGAVRTISDVEIESGGAGYNLDRELKMIAQKKIEGEYWLDIIDKSYFSVSIEALLREGLTEANELENDILIERNKEYITGLNVRGDTDNLVD